MAVDTLKLAVKVSLVSVALREVQADPLLLTTQAAEVLVLEQMALTALRVWQAQVAAALHQASQVHRSLMRAVAVAATTQAAALVALVAQVVVVLELETVSLPMLAPSIRAVAAVGMAAEALQPRAVLAVQAS